MSYDVHPLDLVLFKGVDLVSDFICKMEKLRHFDGDLFSHCGVVVTKDVMPFIPGLKSGKYYVWESTFSYSLISDEAKDVNGKSAFGVQIRDLDLVVKSYLAANDAKIAICPLYKYPEITANLIDDLRQLHQYYGMKFYNINCCNIMATVIPCLRLPRLIVNKVMAAGEKVLMINGVNKVDWVFCSELVAAIYIKLGLLSADLDPENVTPIDFLHFTDEVSRMPLIRTCNYIMIND